MSRTRAMPGPALPPARDLTLVDTVREVVAGLEAVRRAIGGADMPSADELELAGQQLHTLEEEMAVQLAELEAAAAARHREHLLARRLLATLPVALVATDADGGVLEANPAAAALLGVGTRLLERKPLFAYVAGPSRRTGRSLLSTAVHTGQPTDGIIAITPRRGGTVRCQVTLVPVSGAESGFSTAGRGRPVDVVRWVVEACYEDTDVAPDEPEPPRPEAARRSQATLVELCRLGVGEADLRSLLGKVAELLCEGVPWVDAASFVLGDPGQPEVLVSSSALAQAGDGAQHLAGEGPTVDACRLAQPVGTSALRDDERWPSLRGHPARHGGQGGHGAEQVPQGCLALPLGPDDAPTGVVTLYHREPGELDLAAVADQARPYVVSAETLVRDSRLVMDMVHVREQLQEALTSRAVIDQAKGMVMMARGCDADEAFRLLVRMSNAGNRKLRDIAQQLVDRAAGGGAPMLATAPAAAADQQPRRRGVSPRRS